MMASNMRILVPVDGSACSVHALEYAGKRQLASKDVRIFVLHVQPGLHPSRTITPAMIDEYQARNSQAALKRVRAVIKRMSLNAECDIQVGDPAPTIVKFARGKRCGEIVMGNSGLGAIAGLVLGSVARKVILMARCPVVLVK
jgi:nucleotide-binding universal stress UspA family protein